MPDREAAFTFELQKMLALRAREAEAQRQQEEELSGIVSEIQKVRDNLESEARRLMELSQQLLATSRRVSEGRSYQVYSQGHLRLVSAVQQGMRRTAVMDRMIVSARRQAEEERQQATREVSRQEKRQIASRIEHLLGPSGQSNSVDELFSCAPDELEDVVDA